VRRPCPGGSTLAVTPGSGLKTALDTAERSGRPARTTGDLLLTLGTNKLSFTVLVERLSPSRWDEGEQVPGEERFHASTAAAMAIPSASAGWSEAGPRRPRDPDVPLHDDAQVVKRPETEDRTRRIARSTVRVDRGLET